jgi:hypothetical protein
MHASHLFPLNFLMKVGRILLLLAVLTSSLAWLPPAAQAAPQTEVNAAAHMDAWIIGNRLYIDAWDLPRNQAFTVRARRYSDDKWTKLTRVQSNRLGDLYKSVRLPGALSRADRIQVCLKNKKGKQQYCARAWKLE